MWALQVIINNSDSSNNISKSKSISLFFRKNHK